MRSELVTIQPPPVPPPIRTVRVEMTQEEAQWLKTLMKEMNRKRLDVSTAANIWEFQVNQKIGVKAFEDLIVALQEALDQW